MRIHVLQHIAFETLGSIEEWALQEGHQLSYTYFFLSDRLPQIQSVDLLIVMGGPMSVHDEGDFPWLQGEKQFIKLAIAKGIPILGICLGAQLIAEALGGQVYRNPEKEIGWFPVKLVGQGKKAGFFQEWPKEYVPMEDVPEECGPEEFLAFHWHGETFDLPPHALLLASSEGCVNQAFCFGEKQQVVALQFHLETTPDTVRNMVENCRVDLTAGKFIQLEEQILSGAKHCEQLKVTMWRILARLTARHSGE